MPILNNEAKRIYKLPAQIVAALSTGRSELISLGPVTLDEPEQRAVLQLLCDLIEERRLLQDNVEQLRQVVEMTVQTSEGQMRKLESVMEAMCLAVGRGR